MSDLPAISGDVSLFQLKAELVQLMQLRDEPDITPEEREAIQVQIKAYVGAELYKVDGIRSYLRHCKVNSKAASEEAARLLALAASWEAREEWLKDLCKSAMVEFGQKSLEGLYGSISIQANGGVQALEVDARLLPEEFCNYRGWISGKAWTWLRALICSAHGEINWLQWTGRQDVQIEREPHNGRIREAIKQPCDRCEGTGERHFPVEQCPDCGGDGKRKIPGVRLSERGTHIKVK